MPKTKHLDTQLNIRLSQKEKETLDHIAEDAGISTSRLARNTMAMLSGSPQQKVRETLKTYDELVEANKKARALVEEEQRTHLELKEKWTMLKAENMALGLGIKQQESKRKTGRVEPIVIGIPKK